MDTQIHKTKLEEMNVSITKKLETLGVHNSDVKEDWIATPGSPSNTEADPNDAADHAEDYIERRATLSILETRYNNIQRALKKISEGTFGTCEVAGETIESDRLDANPAARTCKAHLDEEDNLEK